jgi:hypothetical protein
MNEEILDLSLILSQVECNMKSGVCIYVQSDKKKKRNLTYPQEHIIVPLVAFESWVPMTPKLLIQSMGFSRTPN